MIDLLFRDANPDSAAKKETFEPVQRIFANSLKDLPVLYSSTVTLGKQADIYILGGQDDTEYFLRDREYLSLIGENEVIGQLVSVNAAPEELLEKLRACRMSSAEILNELEIPEANETAKIRKFAQSWRRVVQIKTPEITEDRTFHILARKKNIAEADQIEEYLLHAVAIRVGIDIFPSVQILKPGTNLVSEKVTSVIIDFNQTELTNTPLKIRIQQSQEGINYQLFELTESGKRIERSAVVGGGTQGEGAEMRIELETTGAFKEDTILVVRAFRDAKNKDKENPLLAADLNDKLNIVVRPDSDLNLSFAAEKIPYNGSTSINLSKVQKSVDYQLFGRRVELSEYLPNGTLQIEDVKSIVNLAPIGAPQSGEHGETLSFETGVQPEDAVFVVQATKNNQPNGETLRLKKGLVLLVEPSPLPSVAAAGDIISSGEEAAIVLENTQKGVKYQLQAGTKTIGEPGYHLSERAIGGIDQRREFGMRLETDFKIGTENDNAATLYHDGKLILPTGQLKRTTNFKVTAIKSYTGLETELSETVKITIDKSSSE